MNQKFIVAALSFLSVCLVSAPDVAFAQEKKPNILVIWGDDIGIANLSAYSDGLMGYETPNIDRIGKEGIRFLQYYGEQSCTAGRSAFLTGQHIIRSGLSKVGFPGAPMGMSQLDPSIGGLLKSLGYVFSSAPRLCRSAAGEIGDSCYRFHVNSLWQGACRTNSRFADQGPHIPRLQRSRAMAQCAARFADC
jgi:hypothetical protein